MPGRCDEGMNLTKNLVGAGIFSLPSALLSGSVSFGLLAMLLVCLFSGSSFVLIAWLCKRLRCETYREIWSAAFGRKSCAIIDGFIVVNGCFACVAYTILVADFLHKAMEGMGMSPSRTVLILCNTCCFMLPLSHARDLSALRYTSMMGLAIIGFVILFIVLDCLESWDVASANLEAHVARLNLGIFRTIAICTGAFQAHYNAPRILKQLHGDLPAHGRTVLASFGTAFAVYAVFSLAGLGLFGDALLGNVLRNYDPDSVAIMMAWFGMAFAIIFTYPLVFTAARDSFIESQPALQKALRQSPTLAHVAITSSMVLAISTVACCIEDVSKVTGTLGAVIGSSLCWICPSCVYLKLSRKGRLSAPLMGKTAGRLSRSFALEVYATSL
ncbi:unnamed protein product, partial [Effrenium voratum]